MKRILCMALAILILLTCSGCSALQGAVETLTGQTVVEQAQAQPRVGFSIDAVFGNGDDVLLLLPEFAEKELEYDIYRADLHYNTLPAVEQTLYRALEYAMERGYTTVMLDTGLGVEVERYPQVLNCLALDSPLLEQNLWYEMGYCNLTYPVSVLGLYQRPALFQGVYISVDNFALQWWQKKQEALARAQSIVAGMPAGYTDVQKAEYLYRHLATTVTYYDYDGADASAIQPYLYDALLTGKTHCDGYTNALSLLYRLAGLECVEKIYSAGENEDVGHTWNCFLLGDTWYNADAAGRGTLPTKKSTMGAGLFFGFADLLQKYTPDNAEIYPVCGQNLQMPVDAHLADITGNGFVNAVKKGYAAHKNEWALVVVDTYDESKMNVQMQRVADDLYRTVHWASFPLAGGRTALLVYDGSLFE